MFEANWENILLNEARSQNLEECVEFSAEGHFVLSSSNEDRIVGYIHNYSNLFEHIPENILVNIFRETVCPCNHILPAVPSVDRIHCILCLYFFQFSSRWYIYALGKAHMRSIPSLGRFPNIAIETVPVFI